MRLLVLLALLAPPITRADEFTNEPAAAAPLAAGAAPPVPAAAPPPATDVTQRRFFPIYFVKPDGFTIFELGVRCGGNARRRNATRRGFTQPSPAAPRPRARSLPPSPSSLSRRPSPAAP
jgi:hypothetical protein